MPIQAIDNDGDVSNNGLISVDAQGDNYSTTFTGTDDPNVFAGGLGNDILVGGDSEDAFFFNAQGGEGPGKVNAVERASGQNTSTTDQKRGHREILVKGYTGAAFHHLSIPMRKFLEHPVREC